MASTNEVTLKLPELKFDLDNPRFTEGKFKDEIEIVRYLYDRMDVNELIQSILSTGYDDFEPLIVMKSGSAFLVLEGNRRLAALRLIADAPLRKKLEMKLPDIEKPKALPDGYRCRLVKNRIEARPYIGFKHINGPFRWDAIAKAKYAADWFEQGGDIDAVSRTLGDSHNTVRRLVNGWYALKQARDAGFDIEDISKKRFNFSHLYTALTRSGFREYVGLTPEDTSGVPAKNPIPKKNTENFLRAMSWLYGQEGKKEPALIESQNPDLGRLNAVLLHPEAKGLLVAKRNLDDAHERVEPPSKRFEDALYLASEQCQNAMKLSSSYAGDPTLLSVAEELMKTAKNIVLVMQASKKAAGEGK